MALVTIKDKFQVTLPAKLRARIGVRVGDLMDATVHEDGILLRPKAVVDRNTVADELERMLRGTAIAPDNDAQMNAAAREIIRAVGEQLAIRHPERPDINRCYQTLFTSTRTTTGDLKQTIVCPPGSLDRSPCGTGTSARVAALHARGDLALHTAVRFEGVLGTCFTGEAVAAEERAGVLYVSPKVTGRAWITGFHQFVLDPDDPLPDGFRIGFAPRPAPDPQSWS